MSDEMSVGTTAVCKCTYPLVWTGRYWDHVGITPRHPGDPESGTIRDPLATLRADRDELARQLEAQAVYSGLQRDEMDFLRTDLTAARATIAALREAMRPALEAEAAATKGPWLVMLEDDEGDECAPFIVAEDDTPEPWHIAQMVLCVPSPVGDEDAVYANARLTAAARNALPAVRALLSEEAPDAA